MLPLRDAEDPLPHGTQTRGVDPTRARRPPRSARRRAPPALDRDPSRDPYAGGTRRARRRARRARRVPHRGGGVRGRRGTRHRRGNHRLLATRPRGSRALDLARPFLATSAGRPSSERQQHEAEREPKRERLPGAPEFVVGGSLHGDGYRTAVGSLGYSLMLEGQEGVTWSQWLAIAGTCERLGFDALLTSDHYLSVVNAEEPGSSDAWTLLGALAAGTERLRLGTMVSPVTFRLPAVLAKATTTVDRISGGRAQLGMGAGWWELEHRSHGIPFPPTSERFAMLEEQLEIVHGLWSEEVFSFEGRYYAVEECRFLPKPVQRPHPPIVLGGRGGPRLARLVARWADEFNRVGGTPDELRASIELVTDALDRQGRDRASVAMSFMTWVFVGRTDDEWRDRADRARRMDPTAGSLEEYLADISRDCIVGTVEQAIDRMNEYAAAGVQRFVLNHELFDDLEQIELLAEEIMPKVGG